MMVIEIRIFLSKLVFIFARKIKNKYPVAHHWLLFLLHKALIAMS
jgi:hypothetical protein